MSVPAPAKDAVVSSLPMGAAPPASFFRDVIYKEMPRVPWDIGTHQPALEPVAALFAGHVLDVGTGLGDNARWLASLASVSRVTAVDLAPTAVEEAARRGTAAGKVEFTEGDVFAPLGFGGAPEAYDALLDSAVFHCIGDDDQRACSAQPRAAPAPQGVVVVPTALSASRPPPPTHTPQSAATSPP